MAPSRRKAERDAVKRAPREGAAGAAGAAAALAALNVNQLGDWTTQAEHAPALFHALGYTVLTDCVVIRRIGIQAAQF